MTKHLPLVSILHYVYGTLMCIVGLVVFLTMGLGAFVMDSAAEHGNGDAPPDWIGGFLASFGLGIFMLLLVWGILIILSGVWVTKRRNRTASIIIAALCLLSFPLGTALGVFTLIALNDDAVKVDYGTARSLRA